LAALLFRGIFENGTQSCRGPRRVERLAGARAERQVVAIARLQESEMPTSWLSRGLSDVVSVSMAK
jgi:hypothetical protein